MRETELRQHAVCSMCGKKIGHTGLPMFWTATINRHGLKADAMMQQHGLTMMLGGNAALANIMGGDRELTTPLMDEVKLTFCETCACDSTRPIAALCETA